MGKPRKRSRRHHSIPVPVVSKKIRKRRYAEAKRHPAFAGMDPAALREYIDEKLEMFLSKQPWWYGHTRGRGGADTRHHAANRQYKARKEPESLAAALPAINLQPESVPCELSEDHPPVKRALCTLPEKGRRVNDCTYLKK